MQRLALCLAYGVSMLAAGAAARPADHARTGRAELGLQFLQLGAEASLVEPEAYNVQLKKEIADNAAVVKAAGIPIGGAQ